MALPYRFLDDADAELAAFLQWNGPPPQAIHKQLQVQTRSGVDNHGLLDLGMWSRPVSIKTKSIANNYNDACDLADELRTLLGETVKIEFAGRNWADEYEIWHDLTSLSIDKIGLEARVYSAKYAVNLNPAGVVYATWNIVARHVTPPV
jgi:hypothetical protein